MCRKQRRIKRVRNSNKKRKKEIKCACVFLCVLRGNGGGKYLKVVFFMMLGCEVDGFFIVDPACVHSCHVDLALHIVLWLRVCVMEGVSVWLRVCGRGCV